MVNKAGRKSFPCSKCWSECCVRLLSYLLLDHVRRHVLRRPIYAGRSPFSLGHRLWVLSLRSTLKKCETRHCPWVSPLMPFTTKPTIAPAVTSHVTEGRHKFRTKGRLDSNHNRPIVVHRILGNTASKGVVHLNIQRRCCWYFYGCSQSCTHRDGYAKFDNPVFSRSAV